VILQKENSCKKTLSPTKKDPRKKRSKDKKAKRSNLICRNKGMKGSEKERKKEDEKFKLNGRDLLKGMQNGDHTFLWCKNLKAGFTKTDPLFAFAPSSNPCFSLLTH
jgi:hypothetical protein